MADLELSPMPLPRALGDRVIIHPPNITGTEKITIKAGWILGVPNVWDIELIRLTLVADATVASRYIQAKTYSESGHLKELHGFKSIAITASQTKRLIISGVQSYGSGWTSADFYVGNSPLPVFQGDEELVINTNTGKAGDVLRSVFVLTFKNRSMGMPDYSEFILGNKT